MPALSVNNPGSEVLGEVGQEDEDVEAEYMPPERVRRQGNKASQIEVPTKDIHERETVPGQLLSSGLSQLGELSNELSNTESLKLANVVNMILQSREQGMLGPLLEVLEKQGVVSLVLLRG
jgi:hypothetical protein